MTGSVQVTDVDGTMSVVKCITCGVPQGSILGPLLFLLYITDMSAAVKCKLLLYAGKTQPIVFGTRTKLCKCNTLNIVCNGKRQTSLSFLYRNARKFNIKTKKLVVSSLIQCHFDYTCSASYSGLSKNEVQNAA